MLPIIISAIVSLLIFFFEQWWKNHHPTRPNAAVRQEFIDKVGGLKYFWMGSKRKQYAGILFDKFVKNYDEKPPVIGAYLTPVEAKRLAQKYANGIDL